MRLSFAAGPLLALLLAAIPALAAAPGGPAVKPQAQPIADDEQVGEMVRTRAVVKIERPEGVCYWQIMGSDSLARMAVKDSGYGTILLSAQIVGDRLQISVAGESQPLETTLLGRYSLDYPGPEVETPQKAVAADSLRFGGREAWTFSVASRHDFFARRGPNKGGVDGCCSCNLYKLTCCPSVGHCLGCGTCGDCCNN